MEETASFTVVVPAADLAAFKTDIATLVPDASQRPEVERITLATWLAKMRAAVHEKAQAVRNKQALQNGGFSVTPGGS
ncbi:MAG: hypothetical protein K1X74_23000 [Pirellulales bacterium]|nr:hypothetical protein [Pirellulales bacterium]